MKRIFSLIALLGIMITAMAQSTGIALSSGGKLTFFSGQYLDDAISAAQPNDTIYLSAGDYYISKSVSLEYTDYGYTSSFGWLYKPLTFIGSGSFESSTSHKSTSISTEMVIRVDSIYADKTMRFESLRINSEIRLASEIDNLEFKNVYASTIGRCYGDTVTAKSKSLLVQNSNFYSLSLGDNIYGRINALNSRIRYQLNGKATDNDNAFALNYCYVDYVNSNFYGLIKNSLIYSADSHEGVTYDHCGVYSGSDVYNYSPNCYRISGSSVSTYDADPTQLTLYDSQGNQVSDINVSEDGTILGSLGGSNPYSEYPSLPTPDVKNSTLKYNSIDKVVTVNVAILGVETETESE